MVEPPSANPGESDEQARRRARLALLLLVPAPSFAVLMNMVLFPGAVGMTAWTLSKVWILALPAVWFWRVERQRPRISRPRWAGVRAGLLTGAIVAGGVLLADRFLFQGWVDPQGLRELVAAIDLDTPGAYMGMALYTCLLNSLLEEYVWRWFVTGQFERLLPRTPAILASAAAFTAHHVIVLQSQFGDNLLTLIGSAAVFGAGVLWSALYLRHRSVWSPWLSHVLVDVAVFMVGARMIFGSYWP